MRAVPALERGNDKAPAQRTKKGNCDQHDYGWPLRSARDLRQKWECGERCKRCYGPQWSINQQPLNQREHLRKHYKLDERCGDHEDRAEVR